VTLSPRPPGACDWQSNASVATRINRQTLGWNAAAASFAYAYARLAAMGFKYVGSDQLIGGVWPDNEPAVASLDWRTGEPNAKYYAVQMLASVFGSGLKLLYNVTAAAVKSDATTGEIKRGNCGPTSFGGDCNAQSSGAWNSTVEGIDNLAACVARCRHGCSMCNYVSYSSSWEDCSWYEHCEMKTLQSGHDHTTEAVTPSRDAAHPLHAFAARMVGGPQPRLLLLVSKVGTSTIARLGADAVGALATVLEGSGPEPGFQPPRSRIVGSGGALTLGPYAVAVVQLTSS